MATVYTGTLEGERGVFRWSGNTAERTIIVQGLDNSGNGILSNAIEADGMPPIGAPHPTLAGIVLVEYAPEVIEGTQDSVRVRLRYRAPRPADASPDDQATEPPQLQIEVGTSLVSRETNVTYFDEPIVVENSATGDKQGGSVRKGMPTTSLVFRRKETGSPKLKRNSMYFVGTLNKAPFHGGDPEQWKCTEISGTSTDGGLTYDVVYRFEYDENCWRKTVYWKDPETGRPGVDAKGEILGSKEVDIYSWTDFGGLNLE